MNRLAPLCFVLLPSPLACASSPAEFETSLSPPEPSEPYEPVAPHQATPRHPAHPTFDSQVTVEKFLLALENGTPEHLEQLLAPGATVREETSGSGASALPALLALSRTWTGASTDATSPLGATAAVPFGPAEVVEISPQNTDAWATVFVTGPPIVEGYWKIHLENRPGGHQIQEVIVPKSP